MKRIPQNCEFYLYDVPNHAELKETILKSISDMGVHSLFDSENKISNTDWHLNPNYERFYFQNIREIISTHLGNIMQTHSMPNGEVLGLLGYWFQQYEEGDYHKWHSHGNCMFSNVYYLDLPEKAVKTSFILAGKEFEVPVKEGQILTFPSCFIHCSKPNKVGTKTVVSFNY
jgi:hypothetical protein